jgi:hypothetical protein
MGRMITVLIMVIDYLHFFFFVRGSFVTQILYVELVVSPPTQNQLSTYINIRRQLTKTWQEHQKV